MNPVAEEHRSQLTPGADDQATDSLLRLLPSRQKPGRKDTPPFLARQVTADAHTFSTRVHDCVSRVRRIFLPYNDD